MRCKACNKYFQPEIYYDRLGKPAFTELCTYCNSVSIKSVDHESRDIFSEYNELLYNLKQCDDTGGEI